MTRLGFGASGPWAERWFDEDRAYAVLRAGIEAGIRDVDTGPSYARGHAELRLGRLLARLAEDGLPQPRVSGKVGTKLGLGGRAIKDFGRDAIHRQLDGSLAALGRPALDVLYLHGPDKHQLASAIPILNELQESGRIKAIGVCADGPHVRVAMRTDGVGWIMAPYSALAPHNAKLLAKAGRLGRKVCVVAPLGQALWRPELVRPRTRAEAWYAGRALLRQRSALRAARTADWLHGVPDWPPADLALAFVWRTLAPDLILTTTTKPDHIRQSAAAMTRDVPEGVAAMLAARVKT